MSKKPTPGMVIGGGKPASSKRLFAGLGALTLVALIVAGVIVSLGSNSPKQATKSNSATSGITTVKPLDVKYEQLDVDQLATKVNYMMGSHQFTEAEKLIRMQSDLNTNATKLSLLVFELTQAGKKDEASKVTEQLAALDNLSSGDYQAIAREYEGKGDKAKAIEYYRKAIDAYNREAVGTYESDIARLQKHIQELQQ